jgi:hypothetical protein
MWVGHPASLLKGESIAPDFTGAFVLQSLRRWRKRRGEQQQTKRPRFAWDQLRGMGLYRLMGHSEVSDASYTKKIIVKPRAGKRHARFERGN